MFRYFITTIYSFIRCKGVPESLDQGKKPKRSSGRESEEEDLAGKRRRREGQGWETGKLREKAREREGCLGREKEGEKEEKQRAVEASAIGGICREEMGLVGNGKNKEEERRRV